MPGRRAGSLFRVDEVGEAARAPAIEGLALAAGPYLIDPGTLAEGRRRAHGSLLLSLLLVMLLPVAAAAQAQPQPQMVNAGTSAPVVTHSLFEGGLPDGAADDGGNLTGDPLFVDPSGADGIAGTVDDDLHLQPGSPAIDAGDGGALPLDVLDLDGDGDTSDPIAADLDGNVRVVGAGEGAARVDLGAYEYDATPVGTERTAVPPAGVLLAAHPNPFRAQTRLQFRVARSVPVRVVVYDVRGRAVRLLYDAVPRAGALTTVTLDGRTLPSGQYFVRVLAEGVRATRPIVRIR